MTLRELLEDFAKRLDVAHVGVNTSTLYLRCLDRISELKARADLVGTLDAL